MTGVAVQAWQDKAGEIIAVLHEARDWLVKQTDLGDVIEFHARGKAIEVYVAQKEMGHDMELAAKEIVRRAERRIAHLIDLGQRDGTIAPASKTVGRLRHPVGMPSAKDVTGLPWTTVHDIRQIGSVSDQEFEDVIAEGRAEGNLSRSSVIRRLGGQPNGVRKKYRTAEDWHYKRRHLPDSATVMERQIEQVMAACDSLSLSYVDVAELSHEDIERWAAVLAEAGRQLNRFRKEMMARD
jgi:hypothetical protein